MENSVYTKPDFPALEPISDNFTNRLKIALDGEISFSGCHKNYCIGIVDIVNSSKITAPLPKAKVCKYYSIFLNSMAMIAKEFGAKVVKNIGDSLLYYFPQTSDALNRHAFVDPLECSMAMIEAHAVINTKIQEEGLPPVNYRVSADYGSVMIANSIATSSEDLFGSTVNICSKINHNAIPNSMVIGSDLYQIVKSFDGYEFEPVAAYSSGFTFQYTVYAVKYLKARQWIFSASKNL